MRSKSTWTWKGLTGTALAGMMILGAGVQGCSSDDSSSGPPDSSHAAAKLAEGFCGAMQSCCETAKFDYDQGSCMSIMQLRYQATIDTYKRSANVVYDGNAVSACADALKNRESKCVEDAGITVTDGGYIDPVDSACWGVLKGTLPPGSPCETSSECASPDPGTEAECKAVTDPANPDPDAKPVCIQVKMHAAIGEKCDVQPTYPKRLTYVACEQTLGFCAPIPNGKDGYGACTAFTQAGAPCDTTGFTAICATGTICDPTTVTCLALPVEGQDCMMVDGPFGPQPVCADGFLCDTGDPQNPAPKPLCAALKADGEDCTDDTQCSHGFCKVTVVDGSPTGACSADRYNAGAFEITRSTCGYGPSASGDPDAGIAPHGSGGTPSGQSFGGHTHWYR